MLVGKHVSIRDSELRQGRKGTLEVLDAGLDFLQSWIFVGVFFVPNAFVCSVYFMTVF